MAGGSQRYAARQYTCSIDTVLRTIWLRPVSIGRRLSSVLTMFVREAEREVGGRERERESVCVCPILLAAPSMNGTITSLLFWKKFLYGRYFGAAN